MQREQLDVLRALLTERRVLALSVIVDDEPVIGLLPFTVADDWHALIVHASRLARHTRGLVEGAAFDALVHQLDTADVDPLQIKRVTLRGHVRTIPGEAAQAGARFTYLTRFPEAESITELGDFAFYRLEVEAGRLVTGFAGAVNVTGETLTQLGDAWPSAF
jgi:hypothetical protein